MFDTHPRVGFNNPAMPWSELEARLSDGRRRNQPPERRRRRQPGLVAQAPALRAAAAAAAAAGARARCPTPSCTATPTSASSTAPRTPRSWPRRRCGSGLEALALTDHDGFYGVVRFAEAARALGLPTVFGAELTLGLTGAAERRSPTPRAATCWCWPATRRATAACAGPSARAQLAGGEKGKPTHRRSPSSARLHGGHWQVLTGCRKGAVPAALVATGPAAAAARAARAGRRLRARPRRRRAVGPRRPARLRPQRRPGRAGRCAPASTSVATNNVHYATPARRPLATALAAVRARRSLDEVDGWLPAAAGRPPALGAEQARRFARYPGVVERAAELGLGVRLRPRAGRPRPARLPGAPGPHEMTWLRELTERGAADRYGPRARRAHARRLRPDRPRARRHRAARLPRLLPHRVGHRRVLPAQRHLLPGPGLGRQLARSATPSASPTPTRCRSACCSSASCRPSATARPTSTSTSRAAGARRPSSTSTSATAARTPPRSPTSSPTGPSRRCATWARRSGYAQGSWTPGRSRSTAGARCSDRPIDHDIPDAGAGAGRRGRALPPPPRHPLRRHGDLRPAGRRGVPGRVGAHGGPHASCSGTRTTAPRSAW